MLLHLLRNDDLFESQVLVELVQVINVLNLLAELNTEKKSFGLAVACSRMQILVDFRPTSAYLISGLNSRSTKRINLVGWTR